MATAAPQVNPTPAHHLSSPTTSQTARQIQANQAKPQFQIPYGPVTATLNFFLPPADGSAPYNYVESPPAGLPQRNYSAISKSITLQDIRDRESTFTLDADAFEALLPSTVAPYVAANARASEEINWDDEADITGRYYDEVTRLLLGCMPGATKVVLFDHTIRRQEVGKAKREPVLRVHIDQTASSAEQRVRRHVENEEEAEELLKGRYRIVNVWRSIASNGHPVVSLPLAVCSGASVRDEDLVGVEHRYPDRTGETAAVKEREGQRWFYWSGMGTQERLLLKCFDSDADLGAWGRCPHTAFVDPRTEEGWPGRESIEVRALVFG